MEAFHKKPLKTPHQAVFLFCTLALLISIVRDWSPHRWSDWSFGDAQTMLAVSNFEAEGLLPLSFLWLPQAYAPFTKLFEQPELNHHAFGAKAGSHRMRVYTHYPSWYSVSYGLLARLGMKSKTLFQIIASSLTIASTYFLFLIFLMHLSPKQSVFATFLYFMIPTFWRFSDSLATMPWDLFFRYLLVYLWTKDTRCGVTRRPLYFLIFYLNGLVAIESNTYIPMWVFLYGYFFQKKIDWKTLGVLGLALFCAISTQFIQNASQLGVKMAYLDWFEILSINGKGHDFQSDSTWALIANHTLGRFFALFRPVEWGYEFKGIPLAVFLPTFFIFFRKRDPQVMKLALLLLFAGVSFGLAIPKKADQHYEGYLVTPFIALSYLMIFNFLKEYFSQWKEKKIKLSHSFCALIFVSGIYLTFFHKAGVAWDLPPRNSLNLQLQSFLIELNQRYPTRNKVLLQLGGAIPQFRGLSNNQVDPIYEATLTSPILTFEDENSLWADLKTIYQLASPAPIAILVYPSPMKMAATSLGIVKTLESGHAFDSYSYQILQRYGLTLPVRVR